MKITESQLNIIDNVLNAHIIAHGGSDPAIMNQDAWFTVADELVELAEIGAAEAGTIVELFMTDCMKIEQVIDMLEACVTPVNNPELN